MIKVKFITSIYSNLYGTEFGGRASRGTHYKWSLLSILKITDANFTCYTSEEEYEDLKKFFYEIHSIDPIQLEIKIFNLRDSIFFDKLYKIKSKKIEHYKKWDRCLDIQYNKFFWFDYEDKSYDYYYWIDAGLSHSGLLPNKWLGKNGNGYESKFYSTDVFDNNFLKNLVNFTGEKIFIIAKDNVRNYWSGTVDEKYYFNYNKNYHIIGGLFGGQREKFSEMVEIFKNYLYSLLDDEDTPMEENILSLMNVNHPEIFVRKFFDTWWCPDNGPKEITEDYYLKNKSFYKVIEEIINNE